MQEKNGERMVFRDSTTSINTNVKNNLNEIESLKKGIDEMIITNPKKHNHESCKGCDGICCSKDGKNNTN